MSKSLNLYAGTVVGIGLLLVGAYNFADRNVAEFPDNPQVLGKLPAPIPEPEAPVQTAEAPAEADGGLVVGAANAQNGEAKGLRFGIGREALPEEIAAWNVDVRPDGTGLPAGSGTADEGEPLFEESCASCHGSFAEGVDNWPKLAGGKGTLDDKDPVKTVGSYWPYTSTLWDYVHRSMPFGNAQSLSADEVYAISAYVLYMNDIIESDFELTQDTLAEVTLPNADGFIVDDRPETEYPMWRTEPCMEECKDGVEITMRATVLDVTPDQEGEEAAAEPAAETEQVAEAGAEPAAEPAEEPAAEAAEEPAADEAAPDPELVAAGEKVFGKCKACHQIGEGAKNRAGPHLDGVYGREIGGLEDFKYSRNMAEKDGVWDDESLAAFLADPRGYVKGTRMAFAGIKKDADLEAIIAYLKSDPE